MNFEVLGFARIIAERLVLSISPGRTFSTPCRRVVPEGRKHKYGTGLSVPVRLSSCTMRPGCCCGKFFSSIKKICTIIPAFSGCLWTRSLHGYASPGGRGFSIMTSVPGGIRSVRKCGKLGPIRRHMSEARVPDTVPGFRCSRDRVPESSYWAGISGHCLLANR